MEHYLDPHSDLSQLERDGASADAAQRKIDAKMRDIRFDISTPDGARKFIGDWEPNAYLAEILSAHARGNLAEASAAFNDLLFSQAEYEAL